MGQQVKALHAESDDIGSVPRSHKVEGKNQLHQAIFWPQYMCFVMYVHTQVQTYANAKRQFIQDFSLYVFGFAAYFVLLS